MQYVICQQQLNVFNHSACRYKYKKKKNMFQICRKQRHLEYVLQENIISVFQL